MSKMKKGRIIKIISNRYQVYSEGQKYDCIAMGKLRKGVSPVVGDFVDFEKIDDQYGIQKLLPRKNELTRPSIANVDQAIIVMSAKDPDFSTVLIDRLIFLISYANIKPVLCVTKMDLIEGEESDIYQYIKDYQSSGYEVYTTGTDFSTTDIESLFKDRVSVLTGQSGAGKSSLINRIDKRFQIKTQAISKALGRGKHTTRHSELFEINEGWVADTPGFSSLDFDQLDALELAHSILDFKPYEGECKFNDCIHINEPQCAIIAAYQAKEIIDYRYTHYKEIVTHIKNQKVKY